MNRPEEPKMGVVSNSFARKSAESVSTFCETLLHLVPDLPTPNDLHVSPETRARLQAVGDAMAEAIAAQVIAQQAAHAATILKAETLATLVRELNAIAAGAIATGVSDATLAGYGFAPRPDHTTRPVAPKAVTGLLARPTVDGIVRLSWDRAGNRDSTVFLIEASADGEAWTQVGATGTTKATLKGFAPGVGAWFRIVATNSMGTALPSPPVAIY